MLVQGGTLVLTVPFGQRYVDSELRIYDVEQLDELLEGWSIVDRLFYRKGDKGRYWLECTEGECLQAEHHAITGVGGVVLVAATAP